MQHSQILSTTYLRVFHKIVIDHPHGRSVLSPAPPCCTRDLQPLVLIPGLESLVLAKIRTGRTLATIMRRPAAGENLYRARRSGFVTRSTQYSINAIFDRR